MIRTEYILCHLCGYGGATPHSCRESDLVAQNYVLLERLQAAEEALRVIADIDTDFIPTDHPWKHAILKARAALSNKGEGEKEGGDTPLGAKAPPPQKD